METEFLAQPDVALGEVLQQGIGRCGTPNTMVVVSAFASLPTVLRIKQTMMEVRDAGGEVRLVLGVDLGGTSKDVLSEISSWRIPVAIVKNRASGVTFHPKIYHLAWGNRAELLVGSNNLTEGGLFRNYEAACRTVFYLPEDAEAYGRALAQLHRFMRPTGSTARILDAQYLATLIALPSIPSEAGARRNRAEAFAVRPDENQADTVFGYDPPRQIPRLPAELQALLLAARQQQRAEVNRQMRRVARGVITGTAPPGALAAPTPLAQLDPSAFYMTLPTLTGASGNIPGEIRIPVEAKDIAENFWGWPANYRRVVNPRGGQNRVYQEWRSPWRIWSTDDPADVQVTPEVRLYFYENSSDFRFYASRIQGLGGAVGDIVRIRRIDEPDAVFECVLAKQGTPERNQWIAFCINPVRNSDRRFGFE